ncbi:MAG: uroporphyrinogen decarboxylase family protein, partial [Desulfatiglandales bacterium]|nr:uroporphyrinogen decarboxylase family protein [Desulfatiglandales bacterium]
MNESSKAFYEARVKRFHDAVSLKCPDRVPIATASGHFFYKHAGLTPKDMMYDYKKTVKGMKASMEKFKWDMTPSVSMSPGPVMEIFGLTQYKWPGYDLPDEMFFQFIEGEYMSGDEYDELLSNPEGFAIKKLIPRMSKLLEPLADLPPAHQLSSGNSVLGTLGTLAGSPPFVHILESLQKAGAEMARYIEVQASFVQEMKEVGFPMMVGIRTNSPFDWISDYLRGMRGTMLDMFRNPDKLLEAIDLFTPIMIETVLKGTKKSSNPRVFIPLHRGAGGFMSNEQFAKFYWPSLKKILLTLIDAGLTPMPFFEGDYTQRLEFLTELPEGKVLGHFQDVDVKKFKKILGDTMCFRGNV